VAVLLALACLVLGATALRGNVEVVPTSAPAASSSSSSDSLESLDDSELEFEDEEAELDAEEDEAEDEADRAEADEEAELEAEVDAEAECEVARFDCGQAGITNCENCIENHHDNKCYWDNKDKKCNQMKSQEPFRYCELDRGTPSTKCASCKTTWDNFQKAQSAATSAATSAAGHAGAGGHAGPVKKGGLTMCSSGGSKGVCVPTAPACPRGRTKGSSPACGAGTMCCLLEVKAKAQAARYGTCEYGNNDPCKCANVPAGPNTKGYKCKYTATGMCVSKDQAQYASARDVDRDNCKTMIKKK